MSSFDSRRNPQMEALPGTALEGVSSLVCRKRKESRLAGEGQMMCGGHYWRTVAVGVEGGSCLRKGTAEKVEVGRIEIVGLGSRARREAVGMIGQVEGRYDFQEAHREVEDNSPHELESRSLEVVEMPSRLKLV